MTRRTFFVLCMAIGFFLCIFCYVKYSFTPNNLILNTIESLPTVKEVSVMCREYDWKNIYRAQISMQDDTIIQMRYLRFDNNELHFEDIQRFGDIVPRAFFYNKEKKYLNMGEGVLESRYKSIPMYKEIDYFIHNKNAIQLLLNYEKIKEILQNLPVVDSSVLSYWDEGFGQKMSHEEYLELVLNEHFYETDDFIYGYFATNANDDFRGRIWQTGDFASEQIKP